MLLEGPKALHGQTVFCYTRSWANLSHFFTTDWHSTGYLLAARARRLLILDEPTGDIQPSVRWKSNSLACAGLRSFECGRAKPCDVFA